MLKRKKWRTTVFWLAQIPIGVVAGGGPFARIVLESRWFQRFERWGMRDV